MARIATPGVYLVEKNAFASSVVAVPTAIPAFVGYTEKALRNQTRLSMTPTRVTSFPEFIELFGGPPQTNYTISPDPDKKFSLSEAKERYFLFNSMRLFYENGGGICYVVSVGSYKDAVSKKSLQAGLDTLIKEQEPTMLVIPDAVLLERGDCYSLYQQMVLQCGGKLRSRVSILDVHDGHLDRREEDVVTAFREGVGNNNLAFASGYYPWVNTTVTESSDVSYLNVTNKKNLFDILLEEAQSIFVDPPRADDEKLDPKAMASKADAAMGGLKVTKDDNNFDEVAAELHSIYPGFGEKFVSQKKKILEASNAKDRKAITDGIIKAGVSEIEAALKSGEPTNAKYQMVKDELAKILDDKADPEQVGQTVMSLSPLYKDILKEIRSEMNLMPPSGAVAGVYSMTDNLVGVFKAPANVSLSSVISPAVQINAEEQEDLNMPINGKAVNAIRSFIGKGVLVWGARTLDGNSQDWKYINVRRTMIMLEQSIKNSIESYVFEPNVARTWIKVKTSVDNFLSDQWRAGALAGASPSEAFEVAVGLGQTMTPEDILEGVMRVSVKVAITRPAEFIVITFQQKMQES